MADLEPGERDAQEFDVERDEATGSTIVRIRGELDIGNADRVAALVAPLIEQHPDRLVIDASGLEFADSSAIALWVQWSQSVREVELRNPPPLLRRVIESMGLTETLPIAS